MNLWSWIRAFRRWRADEKQAFLYWQFGCVCAPTEIWELRKPDPLCPAPRHRHRLEAYLTPEEWTTLMNRRNEPKFAEGG